MIRELNVSQITEAIKDMCIQANHFLSEDMDKALKNATANEESPLGQFDYYKANDINFARIKRRPGDSMTIGYWLRSPRKDNFGDFMCINTNGAIQTRQSDNATCISPIFTI